MSGEAYNRVVFDAFGGIGIDASVMVGREESKSVSDGLNRGFILV